MLSVSWTAAQAFIVVSLSLLLMVQRMGSNSIQGFLQLSQMTFFMNADEIHPLGDIHRAEHRVGIQLAVPQALFTLGQHRLQVRTDWSSRARTSPSGMNSSDGTRWGGASMNRLRSSVS